MDLSKFDVKKEFEKYHSYLSSCLKTPELTKEQQKELEVVLEGMLGITIQRLDLSNKKENHK
jgi:hypothetical protein